MYSSVVFVKLHWLAERTGPEIYHRTESELETKRAPINDSTNVIDVSSFAAMAVLFVCCDRYGADDNTGLEAAPAV